ncbi:MAG: phospholipase C [Acidimicrobiales bacterium]
MSRISSRTVRIVAAAIALGVLLPGSAARAASFSQINHIVVLVQENRSFDNYFGHLKAYDPTLAVEPEPATGNPDAAGDIITPFHQTSYCEVSDLDHSWAGTHNEWDLGKMDGFVKQNAVPADPTGSRAMGYYDQTDLPFYYDLYDHFAISDTYFSSALDQTFPNRFYGLSATSFGHVANDFPTTNPPNDFTQPSIFNLLDNAGISWKVYFDEAPFAALYGYVRVHGAGHLFPSKQYTVDAAAGNLPQVSFIDPFYVGEVNTENDGHPPSNVQRDQLGASDVINALFTSPNWSDSALFITYDEHGGFYDHVPPPKAVLPDAIPPNEPGAFDHLGIRVPFVVVSPWAKSHYVSSALPVDLTTPSDPSYGTPQHIYSHTSVLKTIEERFGLPALTARDAASNDLSDLFDFSAPHFAVPPHLAPATLDPQHAIDCETHEGVG